MCYICKKVSKLVRVGKFKICSNCLTDILIRRKSHEQKKTIGV